MPDLGGAIRGLFELLLASVGLILGLIASLIIVLVVGPTWWVIAPPIVGGLLGYLLAGKME